MITNGLASIAFTPKICVFTICGGNFEKNLEPFNFWQIYKGVSLTLTINIFS